MSWASSRPAPDVAEARGVAEGGKRELTRKTGLQERHAVVVGSADIHDSAAFEDLVDAVAPTEAARAYDAKSTPWQQEGGVAYRAAEKGRLPRIAFSKVSNAVRNSHEKLGLVTAGRLDFPPTASRYRRKL
jgi:hypothetical protein